MVPSPINQDTKSGPGAFNRKMVADPFSSKPLSNPLANGKVISETEPLFNHFSPALKAGPAEYQQNKSTLFEFANDTKNIAQIFPLMNTSDGQSRHPQQQSKSLDEPSNQKCSIQSSKRKDYCSVDDQTSRKTQDHKAGDGMNQSSRHNSQFSHLKTLESKQGMHLLQTQQATARAVSATDMPCSSLAVDQQQEEELRRASFDVATASRCAAYYLRAGGWPTPGGQRRKLPSTEHLEASSTLPASINNTQNGCQVVSQLCANTSQVCSSLAAVVSSPPSPPSITINTPNHIAAAAGHAPLDLSHAHPHLHSAKSNRLGRNNRRTSYLANRSSAVDQTSWTKTNLPRKQNSSPLPQKSQRIYDRSHINSRSCNNNPDAYYALGNSMDCGVDAAAAQPSNCYTSQPHHQKNTLLINAWQRKPVASSAAYSQQFGSAKANSMCDPYVVSPPFSGKKHSAVLTPPSPYWTQRQAKSFDDRNYGQLSSISHLPPTRPRIHQQQPQYDYNMTTPGHATRKPLDNHCSKSQSAARKQLLLRQETIQLLQNPSQSSEVSRECQGLWQARQQLAAIKQSTPPRVQHLQRCHHQPTTQVSTDLSTEPCSLASTSLSLDSTCSISNDPCPSFELAASTITSAEFKRQKYKSLFTQRRPSKGSVSPIKSALDSPSSFDSLGTAGPTSEYTQYGHAATNSQRLASSLDSSRSENSGHDWRDQQQKSVDMSNFTRKPESYSATKSNSSKTLSPTPIDPFSSSHRFPIQQQHTTHPATSRKTHNTSLAPFVNMWRGGGNRTTVSRSYSGHQRDYSVDSKSDTLFRQFSQLEPPSSPVLVRRAPERRNNQSCNPLASPSLWLSIESSPRENFRRQNELGAAVNKNGYNYF